MNIQFAQSDRHGVLSTLLGADALVLHRMHGQEEMSGAFEWHVAAISNNPNIDLNQLLGTHASISVKTAHGQRYFDGIVTEARWSGTSEHGNAYDLVLRPWLHLAGLRRNQRIFHNLTVVQILTQVFDSYASLGAPHFDLQLADPYPVLEYTVQYGESDADFAKRMMERFGISWHWRHDAGNHCLILTDYVTTHADVPGATRPFYGVDRYHVTEEEHFKAWANGARMQTGAVRLTDYNFKTPHAIQEVEREGTAAFAHGQIESFDYPGDYLSQGAGETVVGRRIEEESGGISRIEAQGDVINLGAGLCVTPVGDTLPNATGERFLCLRADHVLRAQAYASTAETTEEDAYEGRFVLTPASGPMRPARRTPPVIMRGPQTAVVVGEGEIDVDEYGRILVQFHWDLSAAYSMRCRVSQNWAGRGWGGMVIPRIGMEVVVEYLDGDPDKPLVTGCVYNGHNTVPYPLPANKTVSTFRTDSHQGGGFNELRFEDQSGREEVFMHAQKDHNTVIQNDESHSIGHDRSKAVANDQSESIGHNKTISVGNDHRETVGHDMFYKVGRNQHETYGKDHLHTVGNILKQDVVADHMETIGGHYQGQIAGKMKLDVGATITTNAGQVHKLMAGSKFEIAGPGGKITIDGSGITLEAPSINLKGNVSMGGSGSAQVPTLSLAANEALPLAEECPKAKDE